MSALVIENNLTNDTKYGNLLQDVEIYYYIGTIIDVLLFCLSTAWGGGGLAVSSQVKVLKKSGNRRESFNSEYKMDAP